MHRSRFRGTKTTRLRTTVALFTGVLLAVGTPATVAGAHPGHPEHDEPAAAEGQFQQVPLAKGEPETGEPMSLAVLPNRSVLHTSRDGTLRLTDQGGVTKVVYDRGGFLYHGRIAAVAEAARAARLEL